MPAKKTATRYSLTFSPYSLRSVGSLLIKLYRGHKQVPRVEDEKTAEA
jgi:hypothetical protein